MPRDNAEQRSIDPTQPHFSYKYSVLKDENDLQRPWDGRLGHLLL